jgi:hypothetical protein
VLGLCRHTALETDGILHLLHTTKLHLRQFICYFTGRVIAGDELNVWSSGHQRTYLVGACCAGEVPPTSVEEEARGRVCMGGSLRVCVTEVRSRGDERVNRAALEAGCLLEYTVRDTWRDGGHR